MIYCILISGQDPLFVEGPERASFESLAQSRYNEMLDELGEQEAEWKRGAPKMPTFDPARTDGREARRMKREHEAAVAAYKTEHPEPPMPTMEQFVERKLAFYGYKVVGGIGVARIDRPFDSYGD